MRKSVLLCFGFLSLPLFGQYLRVGNANYLGTAGGPFASSSAQKNWVTRWAYIFPASVLGNMKHGDTLFSIEFNRASGPAINDSSNLAMYIRNTNRNDFGTGKLYWPGEIAAAQQVFNRNPKNDIGTNEGFQKLDLYPNPYVFDSTKGENLEILVEFRQTAVQSGPIYWYFEDGNTVPGYAQYQTKYITGNTANDSLSVSSQFHPDIIFNYPRYDRDVALIKLYTLGKIPVPLGNPDSVKALVRNVGKKDAVNVKLGTFIVGPNKAQKDSFTFSIDKGDQKFINLPSLAPGKHGADTVYAAIRGDNYAGNDTGTSVRLANPNIYSYRDITKSPDAGGIGFNGSTGDFVARFSANKPKNINQVSVNFAFSGRPFKIGIWGTNSSKPGPGNLIYLSDSLNSTAGVYVLDLKKAVTVSGSFFVGVRQLNTNNVAFGYQLEEPVRPATFFYTAPAGDTNWYDFHPDAPFKFLIEPRLQADTDLTVLSADYPKDSIDRNTMDTMAPKATVANIGLRDILDSFTVTCEIKVFGRQVYKESIRDTLRSGGKRTYTFPKTFYPVDYGEHQMYVYTNYYNDQITDNDTAVRKFYVGVTKDVIIATVYDPPNNQGYEYFVDTIQPVAAVQNPGYDNSIPFLARCKITKGNTVVYNKTQTVSLPKFQSKILFWPTYKCNDTGKFTVTFTVEMSNDQNRKNDTAIRKIYVSKGFDIGIDSASAPDKKGFYTAGKPLRPRFHAYNDGILEAFDVKVYCKITSKYTNKEYYDSVTSQIQSKSSIWNTLPKDYVPPVRGIYTVVFKVQYPRDYVGFNDSLKYDFNVGYPYDYTTLAVNYPLKTDTLDVGGGPFQPSMKIKNSGFIKVADVCPIIFEIWHNNFRVYQDIKSVGLDTSQVFDQAMKKTFNPQKGGKYRIFAYTNYASDVNRKNDTIFSDFWVRVGKNAFVLSIDTPLIGEVYHARTSVIPIHATVTNEGKLKMNDVTYFAEIFYNSQSVYYGFLKDSLLGNEVKSIRFNAPFVPQESGTYTLIVYTSSLEDQNIFDDTMSLVFVVDKDVDFTPTRILVPANNSSFIDREGSVQPRLEIQNIGDNDSVLRTGKTYISFFDASTLKVFTDSTAFSIKKNGALDTQVFATSWNVLNTGIYSVEAIVKASGDLFPENDTLRSGFTVLFNSTDELNRESVVLYPNPTNNIVYISTNLRLVSCEIFDASGRLVKTTIWEREIDLSGLHSGVYQIKVHTENETFKGSIIKK